MRLWHKGLITVLPRQQLIGQWRECHAIAKGIAEKGVTDHMLIDKIMDYPLEHFYTYCSIVGLEMKRRGYRVKKDKIDSYLKDHREILSLSRIFEDWHNNRYMTQCFYNLQEKYDCGGISFEAYCLITDRYTLYVLF